MIIPYRRFGTTYRPHLQGSSSVLSVGEACRILVQKPEGRKPLARPRRKRKEYIKVDDRETRLEDVDCSNLVQDRDKRRTLVNALMRRRFPQKAVNLTGCGIITYWRILFHGVNFSNVIFYVLGYLDTWAQLIFPFGRVTSAQRN
jgi:hypothetical protein